MLRISRDRIAGTSALRHFTFRETPVLLAWRDNRGIAGRLLHNSHVLDIKGRSYRLRDLERAVTQQA